MFERRKDCADRINDHLGPHKASARGGSVERHRPLLRVRPEIQEICRFAARWEAEHQAELRRAPAAPGAVLVRSDERQCQPDQAEARITRQKFSGWNEGSLSASTSALTVPKVVSGLCRIPS